jgi:RNA polymerase sigma-70 factor (sigma-E family)
LDSTDEFVEFAGVAAPRLCRTAFLLCGDWHTAQDLSQTTLAKVFVSWRRINRRDGAHAYAHRTLVNSYLAMARRRSFAEMPVGEIPESASSADTADLRIVLLQALAELTPGARAVVILRYWEDRSVDQVAEMLGWSAGNVRTQSSRALDKLREGLGDALPEFGRSPVRPPEISGRPPEISARPPETAGHQVPGHQRDTAHG